MTSERWPGLAGKTENGVHILPVRVYYEDTDAGGVVYHANYLKFCERGRTDCLRLLDIHHHELTDALFVVRRMVCEFLKPARLDDLLEVETRFVEMAGARLELEQRVTCPNRPLFSAKVTAALIDGQGRPKRLPPDMVQRFAGLAKSSS